MAAHYTFEDYSGTSNTSKSDNPYDALIEACNNDPVSLAKPTETTTKSPLTPPASTSSEIPDSPNNSQRPTKSQTSGPRLPRRHRGRDPEEPRRPCAARLQRLAQLPRPLGPPARRNPLSNPTDPRTTSEGRTQSVSPRHHQATNQPTK